MDQKKYTLTWHTYPDHLRGMMREMMTSGDFADVTLVCDDKKSIRAHRNILSACSTVFKNILQMHTQSNHPVIYMRGVQFSEIESILQFMYVGEARLSEERTNEFMCVVKDLEINKLITGVESSEPQPDKTPEESEENYNDITQYYTLDEYNLTGHEAEIVKSNNAMQKTEAGKPILCKSKFKCTECEKTYSDRKGLRQHNMSKHEGVKYACNQCDYQATRQDHLTRHIQ